MEFTLEQAKDIIGNSGNPNHQAFHKNTNSDVVSAVNKAFETAFPGETDLGVDPLLEEKMADAMKEQPPKQDAGSGEIPPEVRETDRQVDQALRAEFGDDFENKKNDAFDVAEEIFGNKEKFDKFFVKYDIDLDAETQIEGVKFLLKLINKQQAKENR